MKNSVWAIIMSSVLAPVALFGLGLRVPDQDAEAIARGNAFAATADNPSAIYYNPAGLTQLDGHQLSVGTYSIFTQSHYTALNGFEQDTKLKLQTLPQIYYAYGNTNGAFSGGVGFFAPYGLGLEWPDNSPFRQVTSRGEIIYLTVAPVLAWKISPALSIAGGPTINYSKVDLRRGLLPVNVGDRFKFSGDDTEAGYNLGLMLHPCDKHSFGLTYRSATAMNFSGTSILSGPPPIPAGDQPATAQFNFPQQVVLGWSFRPTPAWNLEFDIDWTDWSSLKTVTLNQIPPQNIPFNWQSSFMFEWGVTHFFDHGLSASAGYIFSESSVPTSSFNPAIPDSDRHVFSIGLGKKFKHLRSDIAYQFSYGPSRSVSGSIQGPLVDGSYRWMSHAFTITTGYAF
jgi:long-chain fatty acid transport protein